MSKLDSAVCPITLPRITTASGVRFNFGRSMISSTRPFVRIALLDVVTVWIERSWRVRKFISISHDGLSALGLGFAVFLFHAAHIPSVARGIIFQKSNLAFDFDIDRFVNLWCVSPFPQGDNEAYYAVRHPLAISVRLLCMPLVEAGMDSHITACGIAAFCSALSAVLVYRIARELGGQIPLAGAFAVLWSVSTTTLL